MKRWRMLMLAATVAVLVGCGNAQEPSAARELVVPTSPNAAYQTAFPVLGATNVTVLEDKLPGGEASDLPTPVAAPVVTAAVNEEETPSPVTIDVEDTQTTATPAP